MRTHVIVSACGAALTSIAFGQDQARPPIQALERGIELTPVRIAPVTVDPHGRIAIDGSWAPYDPAQPERDTLARIYDNYGDGNSDGLPDGGISCGLHSEESRWFFGTAFCNMFIANDHEVDCRAQTDEHVSRIDLAWYWSCAGASTERCIVTFLTQRSRPCEPNTRDFGGWALDFGEIECNPGEYYFSAMWAGIPGWILTPEGVGSHLIYFSQDVGDDGELTPASCAQPMLWGRTNGPGTQNSYQFDDDVVSDGTHDVELECYTYNFLLCPSPLGAMVQMWGVSRCTDADFDSSGCVDSRDFTAFLNAWAADDPRADCDSDGTVNTRDLVCYLNTWTPCLDCT